MWSLDADLNPSRAAALPSVPSPSALQDNSSQDTQSSSKMSQPTHKGNEIKILSLLLPFDHLLVCISPKKSSPAAQDGDSLIIVNEHKGKKQESARLASLYSYIQYIVFLLLMSKMTFNQVLYADVHFLGSGGFQCPLLQSGSMDQGTVS